MAFTFFLARFLEHCLTSSKLTPFHLNRDWAAGTANWVARHEATQLAVAATNVIVLSSEMK